MRLLLTLLCLCLVTGCQRGLDDLQQYTQEIEQQLPPPLAPIPKITVFTPIAYLHYQERSPFTVLKISDQTLSSLEVTDATIETPQCEYLPSQHQKQLLEQYGLDSLIFKGSIGTQQSKLALIETLDGDVFTPKLGDFIGFNQGKLIEITNHYLVLQELISNNLGCWSIRQTKIEIYDAPIL